jgi:osmoprotectant transport system substrate-binding protein
MPVVRRRSRRDVVGTATDLLAVLLVAVAVAACSPAGATPAVVIGAGSTDEQRLLAALTREALRRDGVPVEVVADLGGTLGLRRQALADRIDLFWDYTGAAWSLGLREPAPPADPLDSWERVRRADRDQGLRWLAPTGANATFALAVRRRDLPAAGQRDLGWLAGELSGGGRRLCADREFISRPDGLASLAAEYGIDLATLPTRAATEEEAVAGVRAGDCFAGLITATSGAARAEGLVPLTDELRVFPAFVVAPVVRAGSAADEPEVVGALRTVAGDLNTGALAELNARVAGGGAPDAVAAAHLDDTAGAAGTPEP